MTHQTEEERAQILHSLEGDDVCISISAIASITGMNRHTVARHLDSLEILGKVRKLDVGRAKKYLLVKKISEYSLMDICSDLILVLTPNLTVQYLNKAATRHFMTSMHECIGKNINALHFSLLLHDELIQMLDTFSFENPEKLTVQDENGFWFEITIFGLSLLQAPNQIAIICTDVTEKKRSEEALKIAQEKYGFAFHASPDGIVMREISSGVILEANPAYCSLIGYSWNDVIGKSSIGLGFIELSDFRDNLIRKIARSTSGQHRYELKIRRQSGDIFDASCSSSIIHISGRECLLTVIRDISEQKRAQETIRKSEELYRLLADNTQDVIWTLDPSGCLFTYVSPSIERLLGYRPDTVLNIHPQDIMTQASYTRMRVKLPYYIKSHTDGRTPSYCRLRIHYITADGRVIPTDVAITFIKSSSGEIISILGVSRDISSHLEMSKKLQKSEHHYRVLAESVKDVVWIIDSVSRVFRYISPSITGLLGWTPAEICQKRVDDIISPDMLSYFFKICADRHREYLDSNITRYYTDELKIITKSGDVIWNEIISHTTRNEESGAVEFIGISRDITEKKNTHLELASSEAYLRLILDNIRDVIWILDLTCLVFTYVSPSITKLRGYHPDEIVGHTLDELYSRDIYAEKDMGSIQLDEQIRAFESGDDTARYRRMYVILKHRDGHLIDVEESVSLIAGPDRKVTHIIGVSRGISDNDDLIYSSHSCISFSPDEERSRFTSGNV